MVIEYAGGELFNYIVEVRCLPARLLVYVSRANPSSPLFHFLTHPERKGTRKPLTALLFGLNRLTLLVLFDLPDA
jgi:hypothetical protein